jgi:hypothetical protein
MNTFFISLEEGLIEDRAHGTFVRFVSGPPSPRQLTHLTFLSLSLSSPCVTGIRLPFKLTGGGWVEPNPEKEPSAEFLSIFLLELMSIVGVNKVNFIFKQKLF